MEGPLGGAWSSCLTWVGFPPLHLLLRGLCVLWFLGQKTFGRALMALNIAQGGCLPLTCRPSPAPSPGSPKDLPIHGCREVAV